MPHQGDKASEPISCDLKTEFSPEIKTLLLKSPPSRNEIVLGLFYVVMSLCMLVLTMVFASVRVTWTSMALGFMCAILLILSSILWLRSFTTRSFEFSRQQRQFSYLVAPWKTGSIDFDQITKIEIVCGAVGVLQAAWLRVSVRDQKKSFDIAYVAKWGATESQLTEALAPTADQISSAVGMDWTKERATTRPPAGI